VQITGDGWDLLEEGIAGRRTVAQLASEIVMFVCTGNTCRSPMAEAMFRKMLSERLNCSEEELIERGYLVVSAGLATTAGMPASEHSVSLMREEGVDLTGHHSQPATPELLGIADLIVTMTRSHRDSILARFPALSDRVRVLSATGGDVSDPYGGNREEYQRCRDEIREHLQQLLAALK
ncbi:MAG: low molecular weight protein arginine phosphatase, partial [Planctomycetaceae bacterium]|nr:low molecular weight protein arginine phosphatase [Planctomycetaceae bacterium]